MTNQKPKEMKERVDRLRANHEAMRKKLSSSIQEQRRLEKLTKEKLTLLSELPVGMIVIQEGKITEVNRMVLDQLGHGAEEMMGRAFIDFVDPDCRENVLHILKAGVSGKGVSNSQETDLVSKDGAAVRFEIRIQKIRYGRRSASVALLESIKEKKEKQGELIEFQKNEALMTLASGVTHAMGPPLKVISEKTHSLKKKLGPKNTGFKETLDRIQDAADLMARLNQSLEGYWRRTQDRSEVTLCDLRSVVEDIIAALQPKLKAQEKEGARINLKTYLRSVSLVEANPGEMKEMLGHMITNAVEAMPQGGDLYLSTEENAGYAYIFVQDSGVGIPDHLQARVFDPFFSTKGQDRKGLGLSVSQGIVSRHQGTLEIASRKGQGTIVSIRVPLAGQGQKSNEVVSKKKIRNACILVIEDDHMIRELFCQLLKSKGFKALAATNEVEGLHHLRRKSVDLVIIGSQTPDMEGHVLAREIKKARDKLPVALIAGHERSEDIRKSGADLVITKPLDMNQVLNQISEMLMLNREER